MKGILTLEILLVYLSLMNAAAFILMLSDKHRSRKNKWRIPEAALMGVAALGGSIGALIGMYTARHKTHHFKFTLGIPLILAAQLILAVLIYARMH